ncbi:MAG: thrombospondin type 3 repeat-containing protein [Polyangiaceae bacterium]|nr:thrombospondin type 3 repeat-containing protein [Polyangiaceae bacterium]
MVFDVSDGAEQRTPLTRPHPEWNPFEAPDRIRFGAPVRDIAIIDRDLPATNPATGVAPEGIRCDPDPRIPRCDAANASCDPATLYRTDTSTDESGAGPLRIRGTFAFIMLTSGQVEVIDIDDLDAACRGPWLYTAIAGCPPLAPPPSYTYDPASPAGDRDEDGVPDDADSCPYVPNPKEGPAGEEAQPDSDGDDIGDACDNPTDPADPEKVLALATSNEASCNVVIPHTRRSASYVISNDKAGRHEPGLQTFPILADRNGTVISITDPASPVMRATISEGENLAIAVGSAVQPIGPSGLVGEEGEEPRHTLVMNFEDPRAHLFEQQWQVNYESVLPGFSSTFARLDLDGGPDDGLYASDARFCDRGVQSREAIREKLAATGLGGDELETKADELADLVQIASTLPAEDDAYWSDVKSDPVCGAATFAQCRSTFGTTTAPTDARELTIIEAYQDHVVVETPQLADLMKCCFPGLVQFNIRAGGQWVAIGRGVGFLHHVIADPATGVCRDSCDPALARLNGRILPAPPCAPGPSCDPLPESDPTAFRNPMFRLAISSGSAGACTDASDCGEDSSGGCVGGLCAVRPQRDMQFHFVTQGAFAPLAVNLAGMTADIQPQAIRLVPATGELAVTDGSLEGLILINPGTVAVSRQFY